MPSSIYFHRATEAIACMTDDDPPWAEILATAKDLIGADSGTLIMNSDTGELLHVSHVGLSNSAVQDYQQNFLKVDLLADAATKQKAGVWLDSNEVVPRQTSLHTLPALKLFNLDDKLHSSSDGQRFAAQSLSAPLQEGVRFFHTPIPASPSAFLTVGVPSGQRYGLTVFHVIRMDGLGSASPPVAHLSVLPH